MASVPAPQSHWMWLDVLDPATGKVVGSIGTWPG
jgi:hypothetical protein